MARSSDITSFTEHRQHLRDHLQQVRETGRPLYITRNGKTEAIVLRSKDHGLNDNRQGRTDDRQGAPERTTEANHGSISRAGASLPLANVISVANPRRALAVLSMIPRLPRSVVSSEYDIAGSMFAVHPRPGEFCCKGQATSRLQ